MTENINLAVQLLLVGMLSVFLILGIVVALGRGLIYMVNKFSPTPATTTKQREVSADQISSEKIAVLAAVVDRVTQQRGVIKSIQKL